MTEETWRWLLGLLFTFAAAIGGWFLKLLNAHAARDDEMMADIRQETENLSQELRRELRAVEHRTNELHLSLLQQVKADLQQVRIETRADIREMKHDLLAAINGKNGNG